MKRLGILGGGRAAWTFGSEWRRRGGELTGVWLRESSTSQIVDLLQAPAATKKQLAADSELLLIAVSDSAIESVAASIPPTPAIIFHASGAMPSVREGFSLHPLKALPPVGLTTTLDDVLLVFEGQHRNVAEIIAHELHSRFAEIAPAMKARYHAGAVFGSNYVALMLDIAEQLIGIPEIRTDLIALASSAVQNWQSHGGTARFTGPAARGDQEIVESHIAALGDDHPLAHLYEVLAREITKRQSCEP